MVSTQLDVLAFGSVGDRVRLAQRALCDAGFETSLDGVFGRATENGVRDYQRAHGLLPDGRIGPRTAASLKMAPTTMSAGPLTDLPDRLGPAIIGPATVALSQAAPPGVRSACAGMHISAQGLAFIMAEETGPGRENVCWPGGHSGVTLGAGYDMRERRAPQIEADMLAAGLPPAYARIMESAAGCDEHGGRAELWVRAHPRWPGLTARQGERLLDRVVPAYEAVVHRTVHASLWQYEFDALVSVAYNPERPMAGLAAKIDTGAFADAAHDILSRIGDDPDVARGLKARREREVALFLYGDYGHTASA